MLVSRSSWATLQHATSTSCPTLAPFYLLAADTLPLHELNQPYSGRTFKPSSGMEPTLLPSKPLQHTSPPRASLNCTPQPSPAPSGGLVPSARLRPMALSKHVSSCPLVKTSARTCSLSSYVPSRITTFSLGSRLGTLVRVALRCLAWNEV